MNIRAAQRIKCGQSAQVTNATILLIFSSILHIKNLLDIYVNCNNHCHTSHTSAYLQLVHTQNQVNRVYALLSFFYKYVIILFFHICLRCSKWPPSFRFSDHNSSAFLFHVCYMPCPSHFFFNNSNIWILQYIISSTLLLFSPSLVQIFPSASCSQTHSVNEDCLLPGYDTT